MNHRDKCLGMNRNITRRDFLGGVGVAIGASLLPACTRNSDPVTDLPYAYYPPAETGMRGSHPGSFEVAHAAAKGERWQAKSTGENYDLVIVGAGISGLSAAYIYHRDVDADARILILDNHDDFGGHAKRNEFTLDGRTFIGFGGTMLIEAPGDYPDVAKQVIRELGIEVERGREFGRVNYSDIYETSRGTFFDKETFGADYLATGRFGFSGSLEGAPLSESAKKELERLFADDEDYLPGMTPAERRAVLESHTWREYLEKYAGVGEEVLTFVQKWSHGVWAIGADALPAWMAWIDGYPGFAGMDIGYADEGSSDEARFRFPDGNASVARLLVRKLVPGVAPGHTMEDVVTARFDYSRLDLPENLTRIRLNSTVVDLHHQGGDLQADIDVTYVSGDESRAVSATKVIWAGYHNILPHICPDVPEEQGAAMGSCIRAPLVYTNVLIRNWRSLTGPSLRRIYCPGSFYQTVMPTHEVSMGGYRFASSPDEPIILHLQHIPLAPGQSAPEQFRAGRKALLMTPFETFERHVRDQLGRMLGPKGFDPARDIAGITVNRWPHGYAYSVDAESGDVAWWPEYWKHEDRPWIDASRRIGNITIAGTDAASNAMTESAIEEAHRAVHSFRNEVVG